MKKIIALSVLLLSGIFFFGCDDTSTVEPAGNGTITITSTPAGAAIYLDGTNTNSVTPATIEASEGVHEVTLKLAGYMDYTIPAISVQADQQSIIGPIVLTVQGSISVNSTPVGASITIDGVSQNKVTPSIFQSLQAGSYQVKLTLTNYNDTTVTVQVTNGAQTTVDVILKPQTVKFGPIKLWETTGTSASQPSGLDLSSGSAYGVSSTDKDKVDIFYSSTGFLVKSSDQSSSMTRETKFKVGTGTVLTDGADAPLVDATWTKDMSDRESKYVFLYDNDGNYSKIKIVGFGGGVPGEPAWLEVEWIYNKAKDNRLF
jgi:hypothetical protein